MQVEHFEVEFSEFFEHIRHLNYNQSESRNSHPVSGLLINSAENEVDLPGDTLESLKQAINLSVRVLTWGCSVWIHASGSMRKSTICR